MILRNHCASPDHPASEKFYVKKKKKKPVSVSRQSPNIEKLENEKGMGFLNNPYSCKYAKEVSKQESEA